MIKRFKKEIAFWITGLGVPLVILASPAWLAISGVGPAWSILWLLPFSLLKGPYLASLAGLFLGLTIDSFGFDLVTQIPVLVCLGFWWGKLGRRGAFVRRSWNLGLLAWLGTILLGLSYWSQIAFSESISHNQLLHDWALQTLFAQSFVTALLAPLIDSWLLLIWRSAHTSC